jgi:uncharacterized membrane protein HdeD (DUF308 family)
MNEKELKNWWTYTVKGIFAIAFGLIALLVPKASDDWLIQLFGGFIILSGAFLLGGSISHIKKHKKWGVIMFEGVLDIILGLLILIYHHTKADFELFIIFVAIWAISVGFIQLFAALNTHKEVRTRWLLLLNAIIVIAGGFVMFYSPSEDPLHMLNLIGIFAIIFGAFISVFSFGLKEL